MRKLLFILALAFNIGLCFFPFSEPSRDYKSSERSEKTVAPGEPDEPAEPASLTYAEMLKNKAARLDRKKSN